MSTILRLTDLPQANHYYNCGFWRSETLYERLCHWADWAPNRVAFRDSSSRLTYGELLVCVDRLAADLHASGIKEGHRVSIWLPSRIETAIVVLACSRMGYVANTSLHRDYTCHDVLDLLTRASSRALFTQRHFGADAHKSDILELVKGLPDMQKVYEVAPLNSGTAESHGNLGFPALRGVTTPPTAQSPDRVVYLAFTSGTTGRPKGVMHSDNTLLSNGRAIVKDFALDEQTVVYTMSPLSHNMGIVGLAVSLCCGGTFVVQTPLDSKRAFDRILETEATYLIGVSTHVVDLLAEAHRRNLDSFGHVKTFQMGGSPNPSETVRALMRLGVTPQNAFGMTENCSFQYTRRGDPPDVTSETCGRSCEGMEMTVWDQLNSDIQVKANQIGELGVRGASMMLGYFDDQIATERSFNRHGWFMTGDLGSLDGKGNLRIAGRKKDVIIRGGRNIYPARIEDLAMRHDNVSKAAAFPVADSRLGEKVCLALILKSKLPHFGNDILAHLDRVGLSRYDMPEYYVELETFPVTASGKILKAALVDMAKSGMISPVPIRWRSPAA